MCIRDSHDSEHVAIEAEHGRSFGDEALGGLGEHSEHGVSESVAVQQVDARKAVSYTHLDVYKRQPCRYAKACA